jgi:hypothetical protein
MRRRTEELFAKMRNTSKHLDGGYVGGRPLSNPIVECSKASLKTLVSPGRLILRSVRFPQRWSWLRLQGRSSFRARRKVLFHPMDLTYDDRSDTAS